MTTQLSFLPPFCVVGAGKTGLALVELLRALGFGDSEICFFSDAAVSGSGELKSFSDPQQLKKEFAPRTLLVSPGYPLSRAWIGDFESAGVLVSSELELVCSHLEGEKIVGVSGSLGKSTSVSLLGEAAKTVDANAFVGGNLGIPLASYLSQVLKGQRVRSKWMVLELSSYQLERARNLRCAGALLTYFSPNHLDRYPNLEAYYQTKWRLVEACEGPVVINSRSEDLLNFAQARGVAAVKSCRAESGPLRPEELRSSRLVGKHQWDNLSCVAQLVKDLGWPWDMAWAALKKFSGLAHRLEFLGKAEGISFVNDSKATTIESVQSAVSSMEEIFAGQTTAHLWLLLGGKDKNLPWERLATLKKYPFVNFILFGECRGKVATALDQSPPSFATLKEALRESHARAKAGDMVLLSPGGTSLDEFRSFEDRGEKFRAWVEELFGRPQ